MKAFKDSADGYYEFADDAPEEWYAALTPCEIEVPVSTLATQAALLQSFVQKHMDDKAQEYGYDSIASAVTYADEPSIEKFQIEGRAFRSWRSKVWGKCYELFALGEQITTEQLLDQLPQLELE